VQIGEHTLRSVPFDKLGSYDAVVIVTDHSSLDWKVVARDSKIIVDTRNAMREAARGDLRAKVVSI
jgi:UDP-N-acetyl-D-glucosamine dehydrogenase